MSTINVCDLCGMPLHDEESTAIINIASKYEGDQRFVETKDMRVHVNCAVDAKNAVLNLREHLGFNKITVQQALKQARIIEGFNQDSDS